MRLSASWLLWACLSVVACSDDDNGQAESAVEAGDASTDEDTKSEQGSAGKKSSGSAGKGGAGGSKSTSSGSGEKAPSSDSKDDAKDDANDDSKGDSEDESKDGEKSDDESKGEKPADGDGDKKPEGEGEKPDSPDAPDGTEPDNGKTGEGTSSESTPPSDGNQLAVCSMIEGECNQGLACQAPAGPFSAGRGFCSKICQQDSDCSGVAPEGTKYTCSTGLGTRTCEIACTGAEDASCPSGLACVQSGARRRPAPPADAGTPEAEGDASATSAFEPIFHCRHPFAVSKLWEPCNDATNVCGEGLRCASAFWFGGAGHCTKSCEADSDCAKPENGSATPTCLTLVPAFGENPAIKQCVLDCAAAADSCPSNLTCYQGPETRGEMGAESAPAFAWCQ